MTEASHPRVTCQIHTRYIKEQSQPDQHRYVFAYTITIRNLSQENVQLIGRRWLITDANAKQLTIEGEGVVGEQPVIEPMGEYTYTSGTALETPVGVMQGHYVMLDSHGSEFLTDIPPFRLAIPNILN
nr:Co2+/Mg2+ efflux protein ApaG [Vibrio rumoiensis]